LIDCATAGGSESVRRRCEAAYEQRRAEAATIFARRDSRDIEKHGDQVAILRDGVLVPYDNAEQAAEAFSAMELQAQQGTLLAAKMLMRQGNLNDAVAYLDDYVADNAEDADAHKLRAELAMRAGNFAVAQEALQTVIRHDPDNRNAYLSLARAAEREQNWEAATGSYNQYLALNPDDDATHAALARCYEKAERPKDAARIWHRLFADSETLPEAIAAIRSCIRLQDHGGAFRMIDAALERWPKDQTLLTMAAQNSLQFSRFENFTEAILQMAEIDVAKAVDIASRSLTLLPWRHIVELLDGFRARGLPNDAHPEAIKRFLIQLEKLARSADDKVEAEEIRGHVQSVSRWLGPQASL
jgi:tetratricopeptide (TPR) repeat protein